MPLQLDYFYGGEAEQYSFYRVPKAPFTRFPPFLLWLLVILFCLICYYFSDYNKMNSLHTHIILFFMQSGFSCYFY